MALPEPSSKGDGQKGKGNDQEDKDFDPSAEALIDEIDDERTLEEEEALDGGNSGAAVQEELDALKKESEMPIEELLAYYQRMREADEGHASDEDDDDDDEDMEDEDDDDDEEDDDDERHRARSKTDGKGPERDGDGGASRSSKSGSSGPSDPSSNAPESANKQTKSDSSSKEDTKRQTGTNKEALGNTEKSQLNASSTENNSSSQPKSTVSSNPQPLSPKLTTTSPISNAFTEIASSTTNSNTKTTNNDCNPESTTVNSKSNSTAIVSSSSNITDEKQSSIPTSSDLSGAAQELKLNSIEKRSENQEESIPTRAKHPMTEFFLNEDEEAAGMFKTLLGYDLDDSDDLDEDYSYTDDENGDDERDWRRAIHVGPEHQAEIPEGLSIYDEHLPPYENADKLIWKCNSELNPDQILQYLKTASQLSKRTDISISSASVPKISYETIRLYRERMHEILASSNEVLQQENHANPDQNVSSNHKDVYMSQSRKRAKIDLELEQENTHDCINSTQLEGGIDNQNNAQEENSDSTTQDAIKPELSTEEYFQDEEQLLFLLLQCNHNFEEALRRRRLDPFKYYLHEPMSLWSQEECLGFEDGLRIYGKNFRLIRDNKVPTRTHAEVVAFYYLWKKSERYDVYINRYKLDRQADKPVSPLISPPRPDNNSTTLYLYADTCM